jgi:hypothetical protein
MDAEINNVIYMKLYSGPKMAHDKYEETSVARSIDRDSTVPALVPFPIYYFIYGIVI